MNSSEVLDFLNELIQVKLFLKWVNSSKVLDFLKGANSSEVLEFLKGANSSKVVPKMSELKWGFELPEMS